MINFSNTTFKRVAIHTIIPKRPDQESATVDFDDDITPLSSDVEEVIKERLVKACGRRSRAFNLDIEDTTPESFFSLAKNLKNLSNAEFITSTKAIASKLANAQKKTTISGGYLLIIDALDIRGESVVIIIKAEPHDALASKRNGSSSILELIKKLILSPGDKLYKIAALYSQHSPGKEAPNDTFTSLVFDEQFRSNGKPAEYFWKEFLGFSVEGNAKIQAKRLYEEVYSFIKDTYKHDLDKQTSLIENLGSYFIDNQSSLVDAAEFGTNYITQEYLEKYKREINTKFPNQFFKDTTLIKSRLSKKKLYFPSDINLVGPSDSFKDNVHIIRNNADLRNLDVDEPYTILVIKGKPSPK